MLGFLTFGLLFIVEQQTVAIVERFGKFQKIANAGLNIKIPLIDRVSGRMSLRVQQLDVKVESKTSDDVFVILSIAVQYYVQENSVKEAFYRLANSQLQIESYIFDLVRSEVPGMDINEVFKNKEQIANAVNSGLSQTMEQYGYFIVKALVNDINPNTEVKIAMNRVKAAEREQEAAEYEGEAKKIRVVKEAEADRDSKRLSGEGLALQRLAIIGGLKKSVQEFQKAVPGIDEREVLALITLVQQMDMLKEIGANDRAHTLFLPYSPGSLGETQKQFLDALLTAGAARDDVPDSAAPGDERRAKRAQGKSASVSQ